MISSFVELLFQLLGISCTRCWGERIDTPNFRIALWDSSANNPPPNSSLRGC